MATPLTLAMPKDPATPEAGENGGFNSFCSIPSTTTGSSITRSLVCNGLEDNPIQIGSGLV
eukprot:811234-Lingulodinium_polyedra.AAC.1